MKIWIIILKIKLSIIGVSMTEMLFKYRLFFFKFTMYQIAKRNLSLNCSQIFYCMELFSYLTKRNVISNNCFHYQKKILLLINFNLHMYLYN